jgi:hypothetical protein
MKTKLIIASIVAIVVIILGSSLPNKADIVDKSRNLHYEHYCDSIWENNPSYYNDVIAESDEYLEYIEEHGEWWD